MSRKAISNIVIISVLSFWATLFGMIAGLNGAVQDITTAFSVGFGMAVICVLLTVMFSSLD